jgi:aminotransferase
MQTTYKFNRRTDGIDFSKIRIYNALVSKIPGSIDLTLGEPDFSTPPHICKAAKEAIDQGFTHYVPTPGIPELRKAISDKLRRQNGIETDPNSDILVTVGAAEATTLTMQSLINEGDEVLVPDPVFDSYIPNILLAGGKPVSLPLSKPGFRLDPEQLTKRVNEKTRMIVLNSPSNPTGAIIDTNDQKEILDIATKNNLFILSDEVYEDIVYDGYKHHSIASFAEGLSRCITIFSFSKAYAMTGWRVGYVVASNEIITKMTMLHRNIVGHPTSIVQRAALAALTGPQDSVRAMVQEFDRRRIFLLEALEELNVPCYRPKGAFYMFPSVQEFRKDSGIIAESLAEEGAVTVPGSAFGVCGEGHLRISYATSMERLAKAAKSIERWVISHRR